MNRDERRRKGEIREERGLAIINQFGGIWSHEIFETPESARVFLIEKWPGADVNKFSLAMAVRTVEVYRPLGDAITTPMPTEFWRTLNGPAQRPLGSNADEWHLFVDENKENSAYLAVQIAEAIDDAERRGARDAIKESE